MLLIELEGIVVFLQICDAKVQFTTRSFFSEAVIVVSTGVVRTAGTEGGVERVTEAQPVIVSSLSGSADD